MKIFCRISYVFPAFLLVWTPLSAEEVFPVEVVKLRRETLQYTVQAYARVDEKPQYLYFEVPGYLKKLDTDIKRQVEAGQVLAELDTTEIDNHISLAQEALVYSLKKLQTSRKLRKQKAVSEDALDDAQHAHETKRLELKQLQDKRDKHFLRAPAGGTVIDRLLDFSGPVSAATAIFRFRGNQQPWRISAELTQWEVLQVKPGDKVNLLMPDVPMPPLQGTLSKIHPAGQNGLFAADIDLVSTADTDKLQSSMQLNVEIISAQQYHGYTVPIAALLGVANNQGRIFVIENGRAKPLTVKLRDTVGANIMLEDDLSAYADVIVSGQHYLVEGALVEVVSR